MSAIHAASASALADPATVASASVGRRIERARRHDRMDAEDRTARRTRLAARGIREPSPERCEPIAPPAIDLALVPGLGFDARGGRLGYGGGFYDRLLGGFTRATPRVAAAFSAQVIATVPMGERDQYVDLIVTECGALRAQR